MEDDRARSYILMERSEQYRPHLEVYLPLLKSLSDLRGRRLRILNLGCSSGVVEQMALDRMPERVEFLSVDNSRTFLERARKENAPHVRTGHVRFKQCDVLTHPLDFGTFDLILSRDLNHHLLLPALILQKCQGVLAKDGIMLMEDLRFRADPSAIEEFCQLVMETPAFLKRRALLYLKLIGIVESFASAYSTREICKLVRSEGFAFLHAETGPRYHCLMARDPGALRDLRALLRDLVKEDR